MQTFQIDHIISESLANKPEALQKAIKDLGRQSDFDLNSYENWLPACALGFVTLM